MHLFISLVLFFFRLCSIYVEKLRLTTNGMFCIYAMYGEQRAKYHNGTCWHKSFDSRSRPTLLLISYIRIFIYIFFMHLENELAKPVGIRAKYQHQQTPHTTIVLQCICEYAQQQQPPIMRFRKPQDLRDVSHFIKVYIFIR